jgi:hypothetical protein
LSAPLARVHAADAAAAQAACQSVRAAYRIGALALPEGRAALVSHICGVDP